jgi:hypothetical protein
MFQLDRLFEDGMEFAMLCLTPYFARNFRKVLSIKCDPSSLMTNQGVPNLGNITSWNIFLACLESTA